MMQEIVRFWYNYLSTSYRFLIRIMVNGFMQLPSAVRACLLLFLAVVVLWGIFRKPVLCFLSLIPSGMKKGFRCVYLLLEFPVAALHGAFGKYFYGADNLLSGFGEKIDTALELWHTAWRKPQKYSFGKNLLFYFVCCLYVVSPMFIRTQNQFWRAGEQLYRQIEMRLLLCCEKQGWYASEELQASAAGNPSAVKNEETDSFSVELTVSGVESSLPVRDHPSMTDGTVLGLLKNGDIVTWKGELCFAEVKNKQTEPWVMVVTEDGTEGWSRLIYLHPEPYKGVEYQVIQVE